MNHGKGDAAKTRYWQKTIQEAVRSGMSIGEFCRQRGLKESQFYGWQRKLKAGREGRGVRRLGKCCSGLLSGPRKEWPRRR